MGQVIGLLAQEAPERPAITHEGRTINRLELERRTNRLARAYAELGVGQDDLVTIALPNGIPFYEACAAIWKLGATPQPVSAVLPDRERQAIVELADPPLAVGVAPATAGSRSPGRAMTRVWGRNRPSRASTWAPARRRPGRSQWSRAARRPVVASKGWP